MTAEELGGAEVHCKTSGVTDHYALDEPHGLRLARQMVASLPPSQGGSLPRADAPRPPLFDPAELRGLVPADSRQPLPMRAVLARVLDGSPRR